MCYNTKFGRSIRQTLRRGIVVTKIGDCSAPGMGRGWPRRIRPPPHTYNLAKCGRSKSNGIHNTEIRPEKLTPRILYCKVTQGHWNRQQIDRLATYRFLLVIHSNTAKTVNFPIPVYLALPLRGSLWNFVTVWTQASRIMNNTPTRV